LKVVVEGKINVRFELGRKVLIYGPPASGKSLLLRALYLHLSLLNHGCPKAYASSFLITYIGNEMSYGNCSGNDTVLCSFEIPMIVFDDALDALTLSLRSAFRTENVYVTIDGIDVFDLMKSNVKKLCNLKVKTGSFSFLETECEGNYLMGRWRWMSKEEIPFPPDILAEMILPAGIDRVTYLPGGRQELAVLSEAKGPQDIRCFVKEYGKESGDLNGLAIEKNILEKSMRDYSYILVDDVPGDEYYLKLLLKIMKEENTLLVASRDDRVKDLFQREGIVVELPP